MPTNQPNPNSKKRPLNEYARYSAMGFQMAAIIFAATWAGVKLDEYLALKIPVFTLTFSILSVVLSMYYFIKGFLPKK
jgi:Putative F0F1-ATPase subunit Ca2+/Mg2+ transporter